MNQLKESVAYPAILSNEELNTQYNKPECNRSYCIYY